MKILVLSLLRIGDLIMHEAIAESLASDYPDADFYYLVNDICAKYAKLKFGEDRVFVLERQLIQNCLIDENRPVLSAYQKLKTIVQKLNKENFDLCTNFSHTHFSARLMDLIQAKEKSGANFLNGKKITETNKWMHFVNEFSSQKKSSPFHYLQSLAHSIEASAQPYNKKLSTNNKIALQLFTSDSKKNWPLKNFVELASLLRKNFPHKKISVLVAPDERAQVGEVFDFIQDVEVEALPWAQLTESLAESELLITVDTSVQHLAAQIGTPILSLFLGSAVAEKTAPFTIGDILLQPRSKCFPCQHSAACSQSTQVCAQDLSVDDVFLAAEAILKKENIPQLKSELFMTTQWQGGLFFLKKLGKGAEIMNLKKAIEQTSWQIYLDEGHLEVAGPFGSSAHAFMDDFFHETKQIQVQNWLKNRLLTSAAHALQLQMMQTKFLKLYGEFLNSTNPASKIQNPNQILKQELDDHLFSHPEGKDYFFYLSQQLLTNDCTFSAVQKIRWYLKEALHLVEIENKLVKSILQEINERTFVYVSGPRTLSDLGSSAP